VHPEGVSGNIDERNSLKADAECFRVVLMNKKVYYILIFLIHLSRANMPEGTDPSKLNQTEYPSDPHQASFSCAGCKTPFQRPLFATILASGQRQTYYACPRCLTRVDAQKSESEDTEQRASPAQELGRATSETPHSETCQHFFGYLNKREKGNPYPEECLTCPKMIDCLFH
jgi:DNA-directed RNA polymerase subunit RPC12/RpoP